MLLFAAVLIEREGWAQGEGVQQRLNYDTGPACAALAITRNSTSPLITRRAFEIFETHVGIPETETVYWNDAPERTADEVLAALRGAAASVL